MQKSPYYPKLIAMQKYTYHLTNEKQRQNYIKILFELIEQKAKKNGKDMIIYPFTFNFIHSFLSFYVTLILFSETQGG